MTHQPPSDAVVVGGGVIGLGIAWRAALAGMTVTVVDEAPGRGASWAAAGMLAPVTASSATRPATIRTPARSQAARRASTRARLSTWWSPAAWTPPRMPGASPGSSWRHSRLRSRVTCNPQRSWNR